MTSLDAGTAARDLWDDLLPLAPHAHPPGSDFMLRLVAYDIANPRRLQRIAEACEDFGVRVQYSLFECWLEDPEFEKLWARLQSLYDSAEDRLVVYHLDATAVRRRQTAGDTMVVSNRVTTYIV